MDQTNRANLFYCALGNWLIGGFTLIVSIFFAFEAIQCCTTAVTVNVFAMQFPIVI